MNGIKCMYTNADTLTNKLHELEMLAKERHYDVIAITEVLPKKTNYEIENFILEGYKPITDKVGRGVSLFIRDNLDAVVLPEFENYFNPCIIRRLVLPSRESFIIGVFYRSPGLDHESNTKLNSLLTRLCENHIREKVLLMGDFNHPDIDWSNEMCNKTGHHPDLLFLEMVKNNYLYQHCTQPTHHRALQNPNILDLILTNDESFISPILYLPPLGKSHHSTLEFSLESSLPSREDTKIKFLIEKGDYKKMRDFINKVPWDTVVNENINVNESWAAINDVLQEAIEKYIPKIVISFNKKNKRAFNKTVPRTMLDKIHLKRRAHKLYKKFPTCTNYNSYAKARNQVKWESRRIVKAKEAKLAIDSKSNPKRFFQYIASKTRHKENISNLTKADGSLTETDKEKASVLNSFFCSVFTKENLENVPVFEDVKNDLNLDMVKISQSEMQKALCALNVNKSPGPDGLHPRILKELSNELSLPLTALFNKSLTSGKLPSQWKSAEVRPIFKKGNKSEAGNYRPVSLTSIVCKIFEGFIRDAILNHLNDNNLLSDHQFGFSKGRSCVTQLLVTINEWMSYLDENIPVDAIYLDLRKAFDTVPHKRLINKLKGYGIHGNLLSWIEDFLNERTQFVSVNGERSEESKVISGVPQGSVLGPILFIYYINDMPNVQDQCSLKIFADDTKAFSAVESMDDRHKLQDCIDKLVEWSDQWLLKFNSDKCKVMHLGKNNPYYDYYMLDSEGNQKRLLESTEAEKDLGVVVDPLLSFDKHVNDTTKKANKIAGLLVRTITNKRSDIMIPLYKSLVRPILEYGNAVWSPFLKKHVDLIEGVQRRFTKRVVGTDNLSYHERLRLLKLPSLEYRRLRGDLIEVYKIVHNNYDPVSTKSLLTLTNSDRTRGHSYKLMKNRTNTRLYLCFFTNRVISVWNNLTNEAASAKSLNIFKNKFDSTMKKSMYSTELDK